MTTTKTLTVTLQHTSSIPGARWATPKGWEPLNQIAGADFVDGSWWGEESEEAGIVYFGEGADGEEIEANLDDLRVVSTGDCRVIGNVEIA